MPNRLLEIYLNEILYQIKCAKESFNSPGLDDFAKHHHFLIHSAIIHKILFPTSWIKNDQKEKEMKDRRKQILKDYFKKFRDYEELSNDSDFKTIRDHLEHFDERLDKIITDCRGNVIDRNISIGGPLPIAGIPRNCFLRNIENRKFTLLGAECDIEKLWNNISKIEEYINQNPIK